MRSRSEPQRSRAEKAVEICMEKRGGEERISWKIRSYKEPKKYKRSKMKKKINEERSLKEFLLKSSRTQEKSS